MMFGKLALTIGTLPLMTGIAQAQQCLHEGDSPDQRQRRSEAVAALRTLNTVQVTNYSTAKSFLNFAELVASAAWANMNRSGRLSTAPGTDLLPGFELHLTTDGIKYSISLKDKTDPCGFTLYTSDVGIIYTGYPIDYRVTPSRP